MLLQISNISFLGEQKTADVMSSFERCIMDNTQDVWT